MPTSHYGFLATGTGGNETLRANRRAFEQIYLRAMRMVDTSEISLDTELLGRPLNSPIVLAPVGSQKTFHAEGELAAARAASAQGHLQILSNGTSYAIAAYATVQALTTGSRPNRCTTVLAQSRRTGTCPI